MSSWCVCRQELSERLSQCSDAVSAHSQDGGRLTELLGTAAANKLKDMVARGNEMVSSVEEQIRVETDRVKLQRQKSLEVLIVQCISHYSVTCSGVSGCIQLMEILEILEICWNLKTLLEILEISLNLCGPPANFCIKCL